MDLIELIKECPAPFDLTKAQMIAEHLQAGKMEVVLCDNNTMHKLNKEYRSADKTTDVLSFPLLQVSDDSPIGSIVINAELAKESAQKLGHSQSDEMLLMFIHGLLHLLGYDHETDVGQMRTKEAQIVSQFDLPKSLIVRTQEK